MALSEIDRNVLERCLARKPRAWEDFVDRFLGLVLHVVNHSAKAKSVRLSEADRDDLCAEVFLAVCRDSFAVLRHFRGQSSLATYLAVVARRVVVHELLKNKTPARLTPTPHDTIVMDGHEQRLANRDEVERLLSGLSGPEAQVVRLYHLEGKSYQEIATSIGIAENSVGPVLSRARERMRAQAAATVNPAL